MTTETASNTIRRKKKEQSTFEKLPIGMNTPLNREVRKVVAGPQFREWAVDFAKACCLCHPHNSDGTALNTIASSLINQSATGDDILKAIPKQDKRVSPEAWMPRMPAVYK